MTLHDYCTKAFTTGLFGILVLFTLRAECAESVHTPTNIQNYCVYCHFNPENPFSPVTVWRGEAQAALCLSCHNPTGIASAKSDVDLHRVDNGARIVDCGSCHNPHASSGGSTDTHTGGVTALNLDLIRPNTSKYVPGALEDAVFQQRPEHYAFGENNPPYNGICQTCHQNTAVHTNSAGTDHNHNIGMPCTGCHVHKFGFMPRGAGDCSYCHNVPRGDNGDGTFRRRQIFDANGDFIKTSHHVRGDVLISDCRTCHYLKEHSQGTVILQDQDQENVIYRYDPTDPAAIEPFCLSCHDADGSLIGGGTRPFSDGVTVPNVKGTAGSEWANAAHKTRPYAENGGRPLTCLGDGTGGCHSNAHGSDNEKLLALPANTIINQFCFNCHTSGKVINDAISGPALANNIQDAFSLSAVHNLETTFKGGSYNFSLQCTTCHNPHVVTGKHTDAAANQSPVTRPDFSRSTADNPRAMGTQLWGALSGQKADDYAASGTYRAPKNDPFSGSELPDYNSLCLDCHGVGAMPTPSATNPNDHGGINWNSDPHGLQSANVPSGGGTVPDWYGSGKATGWDGDDCIATESECWPVITRGKGEQIWTRLPYNQEERIAGANFVLQCVDCHEAHGSNNSSMLRTDPNGGTGTWVWNTMCNNCHYYYSDWHAGMSCGNASCHVSNGEDRMYWTGVNTLHQMGHNIGAGNVRSFDPTLVADLRFNNNLYDSGDWRMHSRWFDTTGSFAAGRNGSAVVLNGDQPIELGTRNNYWSTDEGRHGTWKYTEMKYNTTLEAWVNPSDDANNEYIIFTKHVPYSEGGYRLSLQKINNGLSAVFYVNVSGDSTGVRGAYSSVNIPLNKWSHVAAVFDTAGPDRDPLNPSAGRIRIYVNGEDVTTSDSSGNRMQPGPGEVNIFPYSEHSPANQAICYASHWCASAFSVGGLMWSSGSRSGFVGMLDEAKIWNISKPIDYFQTIDSTAAPRIIRVSGAIGSTQLIVYFSEGIQSASGGALQLSDFSYSNNSGSTIVAVDHEAGADSATLTLSSPLSITNDIGVGLVQVNGLDEYGNLAEANDIVVSPGGGCPSGQVAFALNEAAGSSYVLDSQGFIAGLVNNPALALPGDGLLHVDGANFVTFDNNTNCLQADQALTIEARFKPTGIGLDPYITRILARDTAGSNYQVSVWRGNPSVFPAFTPPEGVASIAFWLRLTDAHGGTNWKPVLTDYTQFPIVSDHWYRVKVVWNSNKPGGTPDQPYVQADIFLDDEGTDGNGTNEQWTGFRNATNAAQSYLDASRLLYTGDTISVADGVFAIGVNANNNTKHIFNGLIDWVIWQGVADYTGVDDPPN